MARIRGLGDRFVVSILRQCQVFLRQRGFLRQSLLEVILDRLMVVYGPLGRGLGPPERGLETS